MVENHAEQGHSPESVEEIKPFLLHVCFALLIHHKESPFPVNLIIFFHFEKAKRPEMGDL